MSKLLKWMDVSIAKRRFRDFAIGILGLTIFMPSIYAANEVVVYTARNEQLVKPLFDAFKKDTGIEVKYITDTAPALMERLKAEGKRSPADVLFTVDAGNLWQAANLGLLQPIASKTLESNVPKHLRDSDGQWFGLSIRARTIVYNTEKVKPQELKDYIDLASPKWKGKLCLRTSQKVYNQSLVAMMIAEHGEKKTEEIVKGWVNNLATTVFSNDTNLIKAVNAGQCHVGIVNSYYFAELASEDPNLKAKLFWPKKDVGGTHVNISGAGVTKEAKNKENAVRLLEWLSADKAQKILAELNFEFPVSPKVPSAPLVQAWGPFDQNLLNVSKAGELQATAIKLMDRAGYR